MKAKLREGDIVTLVLRRLPKITCHPFPVRRNKNGNLNVEDKELLRKCIINEQTV